MKSKLKIVCVTVLLTCPMVAVNAAVIFGNTGLNGGSRWDAAARTINGNERSLDGGLRYSLQGGSYQAYRDLFSWQGITPSVTAFEARVKSAFNAWTIVDPVSGLGTKLRFTEDLGTNVVGSINGGGINTAGAEIDLFGSTNASFWNTGNSSTQGETFFNTTSGTSLTLTSGTTGYSGFAISGVDITMNSNSGALYTLDVFETILTHEIGHAIGLGDVDTAGNFGNFIDDNYDDSSNATALDTLTNSWANLVNPLNPADSSELSLVSVVNGTPGIDTVGVDILMETNIPASLIGNDTPLQNDDFGGRQFLYPTVVPIPAGIWLFITGLLGFLLMQKTKDSSKQYPLGFS